MRANEEGAHTQPPIFTLDISYPQQPEVMAMDQIPVGVAPTWSEVTNLSELPSAPIIAEYRNEPVVFDFAAMQEGDTAYLTAVTFSPERDERKEPIMYQTVAITRDLGFFTARFIDLAPKTPEKNIDDPAAVVSQEDVAFLVEPLAAANDVEFTICLETEKEAPRIRLGSFLLAQTFFPDIGHTDYRWRFGPILEAVHYHSREVRTLLDNPDD